MDAKTFFEKSVQLAGNVVTQIETSQLTNSTPCSEWDLQALLNHIVYEIIWIPDMMAGVSFKETGEIHEGNLLGDDFKSTWGSVVAAATKSINDTPHEQIVHMSSGDAPASAYIDEVAVDILIHGWDVAKSIAKPYDVSDELLDRAEGLVDHLMEAYGAYGVFGTPLIVSPDADRFTKLLAKMGREA
jgi:uncharacterized protein (TIGR03086 family)